MAHHFLLCTFKQLHETYLNEKHPRIITFLKVNFCTTAVKQPEFNVSNFTDKSVTFKYTLHK